MDERDGAQRSDSKQQRGLLHSRENVPLGVATCEAGKCIALTYVIDSVHHT